MSDPCILISAKIVSRLNSRNRALHLEVNRLNESLGSSYLANESIKGRLTLSYTCNDRLLARYDKLNAELLAARKQIKELAPRWFEFWRK